MWSGARRRRAEPSELLGIEKRVDEVDGDGSGDDAA